MKGEIFDQVNSCWLSSVKDKIGENEESHECECN